MEITWRQQLQEVGPGETKEEVSSWNLEAQRRS